MRKAKRFLLFSILACLLNSCTGFGLLTKSSHFKRIGQNTSGNYLNRPYKSKGRNIPSPPSILDLFEMPYLKSDSVSFSFTAGGNLKMTFNDGTKYITTEYRGRFTRKGYFEIYIRDKDIEILPFFPIFYSKIDIYRIRIGLTKDDDLVIDNMWNHGGNILFLAAGERGRRQNYFKKIPFK